MFVNVAVYRIKPEHVAEFKERVLRHAATCLRDEKNCLRFDVNQSRADGTQFLMYEIFRSADDMQTHIDAPHTKEFARTRDEKGWLAERTLYQLDQLFPVDGS